MLPNEPSGPDFHIIDFTDTPLTCARHGRKASGVVRFLSDLAAAAERYAVPLTIVAPGKTCALPHTHLIRAPLLPIEQYPGIEIAVPLAHHRAEMERVVQGHPRPVVHVTSPGPFGLTARSIARQFQLPLVGIDHTRFDQFVQAIVASLVANLYRGAENVDAAQWLPDGNGPGSILTRYVDPESIGRLNQILADAGSLRETMSRLDVASLTSSRWSRAIWAIALRVVPHLRHVLDCQRALARIGLNACQIMNSTPASFSPDYAGVQANRLVSAYLRWFYRDFTMLIARSEQQLPRVQEMVGERARVLPPGIDTRYFVPRGRRERGYWQRQQVPAKSQSPVFLYVGRINPEKNIHFLARMWKRLSERLRPNGPPPLLVMVGAGTRQDMAAFSAQAGPGVHFLGSLDGEHLLQAYENSDVLLFPSIAETFGQVVAEANAMQLPAIVSNQGGPASIVSHQRTGFVLPAATEGDVTRWVDAACQLIGDPVQRSRFGRRARDRVVANLDLEHSVRKYKQLHAEAKELHDRDQARRVRLKQKVTLDRIDLPDDERHPGLLWFSDYHAGKKKRNVAALRELLRLAQEHRLQVALGGDFGDHMSHHEKLVEDFRILRETQCELAMRPDLWNFIPGNHDYGYETAQLQDWLGGVRVHQSLVWFDDANRIAGTHGQILGLRKVILTIESTGDKSRITQQLTLEKLDEELKPAIIAHDLTSTLSRWLERSGLELQDLWDRTGSSRQRASKAMVEHALRHDDGLMLMTASLLGPQNDAHVVGRLAAQTQSWLGISGHTHLPSLQLIAQPAGPRVIVANSGKFYGKRLTAVLARFPTAIVIKWNRKQHQWVPWRKITLNNEDQAHYEASWASAGTVPCAPPPTAAPI